MTNSHLQITRLPSYLDLTESAFFVATKGNGNYRDLRIEKLTQKLRENEGRISDLTDFCGCEKVAI